MHVTVKEEWHVCMLQSRRCGLHACYREGGVASEADTHRRRCGLFICSSVLGGVASMSETM